MIASYCRQFPKSIQRYIKVCSSRSCEGTEIGITANVADVQYVDQHRGSAVASWCVILMLVSPRSSVQAVPRPAKKTKVACR